MARAFRRPARVVGESVGEALSSERGITGPGHSRAALGAHVLVQYRGMSSIDANFEEEIMSIVHASLRRLSASLALVLMAAAGHAAPPLPGAIFTTLSDGNQVNANIFSAKCDSLGVYLDGGPGPNAPQTAAGLPDGDYFFQVTDPSGKTLLSTDAQQFRRFTVAGGIITSRVAPAAAGDHDTGTDVDHGATTIELCPFLDTPNPGGEYKVWVTPVGDFAGNAALVDNGYNPGFFHGFIPAASKTDNFKVKARKSVCLTIVKFRDDGDGRFEGGEPTLNWPVLVYDPLGAQMNGIFYTGTDDTKNPTLQICALTPGTYRVVELATDGTGEYDVTATILDNKSINPPTREVNVSIQNSNRTLTFGNTPVKTPPGK